jgi:hypothetical protein
MLRYGAFDPWRKNLELSAATELVVLVPPLPIVALLVPVQGCVVSIGLVPPVPIRVIDHYLVIVPAMIVVTSLIVIPHPGGASRSADRNEDDGGESEPRSAASGTAHTYILFIS